MSRIRGYIETDVLTEARKRMRHIYNVFDSVAVCFSGGKDSLVALHLAHEVAQERGLPKVHVIFRDEELIPDEVVEFVNQYRQKDWIRMLWFAVPLKSQEFVLGKSREYIQWDPNRKHVRPIPEWAIKLPAGDARTFDQYTMDHYCATYFKGRIAFVTGVRASESLVRYQACCRKLNENYLTKPFVVGNGKAPANVMLAKPIFDWEEDDIFRYFYDQKIDYCPIYDMQLWAGYAMRVSTPLHAENAKRFDQLKIFAPTLYEQVIDVFPEMLVHERYYRDLDKDTAVAEAGRDYNSIRRWVMDNMPSRAHRALAFKRIRECESMESRSPGTYPPEYVARQILNGSIKRSLMPVPYANGGGKPPAKRKAAARGKKKGK
jgi:predicted phosphoadenosine phosphosulfate sulfurtransferase